MAKLPEADPFDEGDGTPLSITAGSFEGAAAGDEGVAGWDTSPKPTPNRRGLYVAISLFVLMALIVPLGVGFFANIRREYIAEQAATGASPTLVELSDEVQAVQQRLNPIQAAFIMSSGIADDAVEGEMSSLVTDATSSILSNDATKAQSSTESAESYFVATYSQSLPDRAHAILENYPFSEYETDARIDELIATIQANSQGQDLPVLVSAVMELPQRIGDAMSEHLGNRVTWVPPSESGTPEPTTDPGTIGPPGQTNGPGNTGGFGNSKAGQDGDDDADEPTPGDSNPDANGNDDDSGSTPDPGQEGNPEGGNSSD